jgi:hypothetical protein
MGIPEVVAAGGQTLPEILNHVPGPENVTPLVTL